MHLQWLNIFTVRWIVLSATVAESRGLWAMNSHILIFLRRLLWCGSFAFLLGAGVRPGFGSWQRLRRLGHYGLELRGQTWRAILSDISIVRFDWSDLFVDGLQRDLALLHCRVQVDLFIRVLQLWLTRLSLRAQRTLLHWLGLLLLLLLLLTSLWGKCSVLSLRLFLLLDCLFGVVDSWLVASFKEILLTGLWLNRFSSSSLLPSRTQSLIQAVTTLSERNHVRILRVPVPGERYCVDLSLIGRFEGFLWLARG